MLIISIYLCVFMLRVVGVCGLCHTAPVKRVARATMLPW